MSPSTTTATKGAASGAALGVRWQAERDTALGTRERTATPDAPAGKPSEGGVALTLPAALQGLRHICGKTLQTATSNACGSFLT